VKWSHSSFGSREEDSSVLRFDDEWESAWRAMSTQVTLDCLPLAFPRAASAPHVLSRPASTRSADLPGRPDLVFRKRKKVIFVHGCFWHRHPGCKLTRTPKSRVQFWRNKLEANHERDLRNQEKLRADGWKVLVVWECEIGETEALKTRVRVFLEEE
jgi:DNA mismatch endonuclease (patch repair protein)